MQRQIGNDFDVTGEVRVNDPVAVCAAVEEIFTRLYPDEPIDRIGAAFKAFTSMFRGELPGYKGCDTLYHDMQHTLDMTLAMARMMAGYERTVEEPMRLGPRNATIGIIDALFHDSGYILHSDDDAVVHGAEYTMTHVSRSAQFIEGYLMGIGMAEDAAAAGQIVHFTGYERAPEDIELHDPKHRLLGELLGSADLVAQMADRCYLEKCRDRLFPEFVLGGLAVDKDDEGKAKLKYRSGVDLLRQTPEFFENVMKTRLQGTFNNAYRYVEGWFDGRNPYVEGIRKNLDYLAYILEGERWEELRRRPPANVTDEDTAGSTHKLAVERLRELLATDGQ